MNGIWVSPNMEVTAVTLKDGTREVTDHSLVEVSILLDKDVSRSLPHKVDTFTTQADVKEF